MQVEIRILSGARRGEHLTLSAGEIIAGGQAGCDVFFDPKNDPSARGVCLQLLGEADGWRIRKRSGGTVMVNQQVLDSEMPLRSRDVVRLSPAGPDFRFTIAAPHQDGHALPQSPPVEASSPPAASLPQPATAAPAALEADDAAGSSPPQPLRVGWAAAAALLLLLLAAAWFLLPRHQGEVVVVPPRGESPSGRDKPQPPLKPQLQDTGQNKPDPGAKPNGSAPPKAAENTGSKNPGSNTGASAEGPGGKTPPPPEKEPPVDLPPPQSPGGELKKATPPANPPPGEPPVALLAVEDARHGVQQPFAVACAAKQDGHPVLLTTARLATLMGLAGRRHPPRFFALLPDDSQAGVSVVELDRRAICLHLLYTAALEERNREGAEFFDLACLTCLSELPPSYPLRTVAKLKSVEAVKQGGKLTCWTLDRPPDIPFRDGKVEGNCKLFVRKQSVQLEQEIFLDSKGDADNGQPGRRLFELQGFEGDLHLLEGSPVLNEANELVAICTKVPEPEPRQPRLPRAALIDAEMLSALWTGLPAKQWAVVGPGNTAAAPEAPSSP